MQRQASGVVDEFGQEHRVQRRRAKGGQEKQAEQRNRTEPGHDDVPRDDFCEHQDAHVKQEHTEGDDAQQPRREPPRNPVTY